MRAKFKLREIESSRDFSVNEILTKKGEPTGYNAEAVKYYDGSVNYWRIRNTRTNMWKRCESEKELFSILEKIKSDPEYAEKFEGTEKKAEDKALVDFKLKELYSGEDYTVNEILTEKGKKTGYNAKAIRYMDGKICYWRLVNVKSKMWKRCLTWQDVCGTLQRILTDSEYAKVFERSEKKAEAKAIVDVSEQTVDASEKTTERKEDEINENEIFHIIAGLSVVALILVIIFTAHIWIPFFLKLLVAAASIGALIGLFLGPLVFFL